MKTSFPFPLLSAALLALHPCARLSAADPAGAPPVRGGAVLITATASVEAINLDKREVTLKGALGNVVTFTVDKKVKRLNEFKIGDFVRADYYISLAAEIRKPTPGEEKNPIVELDAAGKAAPGMAPAAGGLRRLKVVTTIEGLDRPTQTATIKGPLGNYWTVRVADAAVLTQLHIGETAVVTCTEALAISLEKADKKTAK
jgi:hypothetical protein